MVEGVAEYAALFELALVGDEGDVAGVNCVAGGHWGCVGGVEGRDCDWFVGLRLEG